MVENISTIRIRLIIILKIKDVLEPQNEKQTKQQYKGFGKVKPRSIENFSSNY